MGQPPNQPPNDPQQPYGQPQGYGQQVPQGQPYHPQHGQQPPPYGYQQPMPHQVTAVSKERGLGGLSHTVHLVLTVCTCGIWGLFVWLPWWLFRMIVPKKTKTTYHYR